MAGWTDTEVIIQLSVLLAVFCYLEIVFMLTGLFECVFASAGLIHYEYSGRHGKHVIRIQIVKLLKG